MPNLSTRPLYCVKDGGPIYTLNKKLNNLAQKSEDDAYRVVAGSNFHIPEKGEREVQQHRHRTHRLAAGSRERENETDKHQLLYMIHKADNLEAIVRQLYDAVFRPNIKHNVTN